MVKAFSNETHFIAINRAIKGVFDVKHPFGANRIVLRIRWNQLPSATSYKSYKFFTHSLSPMRIFEGLMNASGI